MTRHFRELSQRARLAEFVFSESGAMSAKKAAQMGAVLAGSAVAGLLMSVGTAEAACPYPCDFWDPSGNYCVVHYGLPSTYHCRWIDCSLDCDTYCTQSTQTCL